MEHPDRALVMLDWMGNSGMSPYWSTPFLIYSSRSKANHILAYWSITAGYVRPPILSSYEIRGVSRIFGLD